MGCAAGVHAVTFIKGDGMVTQTALEDHMMKICISALLMLLSTFAYADLYITIIQGMGGAETYDQQFSEQVEKVSIAAKSVTEADRLKVFTGPAATRDNILSHFEQLHTQLTAEDRLTIYMIGHGSYDDVEYKFMIQGPDLTDADLLQILGSLPATNQVLVNTGSSSGALLEHLKADGRIIITGTRNGNERLATRFGGYFADAFVDPAADVNKNNAVSVQEAFDYAERMVKDHFEYEGILATEHPVIQGEMAAQFVLARGGPSQPQAQDPQLAGLTRQRDAIDSKIEDLLLRRSQLEPQDYLEQLQTLMIELSLTQGEIEQLNRSDQN